MVIMETKFQKINIRIKKHSYYVLVVSIFLIVYYSIGPIIPESNHIIRRLKAIIGYFIALPFMIVAIVLTIKIFSFYISRKFKPPIKYLVMITPFLIFMLWFILTLFIGVILK